MEQARWGTPSKVQRVDSPLINNLWMHRTPVKQNEMQLRRALETQNNAQSLPFTGLSTHITPPSKLRKLITRNPFEPDLINRLHLPVISPTVFTKVSSPVQESPGFKWNIDELARINPAKIEEFPVHQVYSPDPELEVKAQAAIDRFFKQNHIIPSPWDIKQKENKPPLNTPNNRLLQNLNSIKDLSKSKKDVWSQTVLSLPIDLPQNVEEALKPFLTFTQEQNTDGDDINLSNNSLRRKLFFNHDECTDNDSFISLSPVKTGNSMTLSCSPPQSGMFVHGTPLKRSLQTRHNNKSSAVKSKSVSPDLSPIHTENNVLHKKIANSSHSAIRLDFAMDMSIDNVVRRKENSINDTSLDKNNVKHTEDNHEIIVHNNKTNICDSINMEELPRCINSVDMNTVYFDAVLFNNKGQNNDVGLKIKTEIESSTQESHKQSKAIFGTFNQQSISNSIQDTGYQTYSMNSTMHTVDSYSNISANYKTRWNERQVTSKDNNTQLSWRENIGNVFSSTPSKRNKN
ncbi:hypothetical protein ACFW04_006296 [Cataglyphis niger]